MKKWIERIPPYLKNKYAVSLFFFVLWLLFFDENNLINQYKYQRELSKLEEDKAFYVEEINKIEEDLEELRTNPVTLEKFAREKYLMKKENEELFVIVEEK